MARLDFSPTAAAYPFSTEKTFGFRLIWYSGDSFTEAIYPAGVTLASL
jgi:hypothetical protein